MLSTEAVSAAVREARKPKQVEAGGISRAATIVSKIPGAERLPRALLILLENVVRRAKTDEEAMLMCARILEAGEKGVQGKEIEFMPSRVLFQDFTGVPVFVDFAAMRDAMAARGGDPEKVNPHIPTTLIIDHSVIAEEAGCAGARAENERIEAERNRERFAFLKWASRSFENVKVVPPAEGICHQLNMERFSKVVGTDALWQGEGEMACFDTLVGTDSHTTTVNGIGCMGWGVGGIEAEAAALGQSITMLVPEVVELRLEGKLRDGISGMDCALTVCELLRKAQVVGSLVEVTGPGVAELTATQRACIANMTPEYGATTTLFPVDAQTFKYLALTGRDPEEIVFIEAYLREQGMLGERDAHYARTYTLDLSTVEPCLAGPSRPHRRVAVPGLKARFEESSAEHGHKPETGKMALQFGDRMCELDHGALAIAAITSCTTATDPAMMVAAGLVAKKATDFGLEPKPWVKKIMAPGSHATLEILKRAHLTAPLEKLGFFTCGFGCMSCIGNSGSIAPALHEHAGDLELTSILSGNRNFDGRISPDVAQNYLAEPALVVAYSLVGTLDADLSEEPVGTGKDGKPVMLCDLLPADEEIRDVLAKVLTRDLYEEAAEGLFEGSDAWKAIPASSSATYAWDKSSTYVRRPPYFEDAEHETVREVKDARVLALLGDFVTTDHISPAGTIAEGSPAARYLTEHGVPENEWNTYGTRRGNHEVMMRGTFANVKLENALAQGRQGGYTYDFKRDEVTSIYDAAMDYKAQHEDEVVIAGKMYGSGSSRDWAGKGPALLGVKAVLAESFERIHRSNLIGMGIVPLQFEDGVSAGMLGLDGTERITVEPIDFSKGLPEPKMVAVSAVKPSGEKIDFRALVRVDTPSEGAYISEGGILPYVLGQLV